MVRTVEKAVKGTAVVTGTIVVVAGTIVVVAETVGTAEIGPVRRQRKNLRESAKTKQHTIINGFNNCC